MSVETAKPVEETPVSKAVPTTEQPEAPKATETPAVAEATVAAAVSSDDAAPAPATENPTTEANTVVAATPASEGFLGYKEHGFLKSLRYSKHYFWFAEEAATSESLATFIKSEKGDATHHAAAWAQETGNGVLYYSKRIEDKATPTGVIVLADASSILKEGTSEFSFTVGKVHHRFQTVTSPERDSWIVALQKKIEEAKGLKEEITARDSYKKTIEGFAVVSPATAIRSSSKGPKKSLDAATATAAASEPVANPETASTSSSDADKKAKKEAEKSAKKERSQSRKRASIFGILGKKDEDKDVKKAEKEHEKEVKKVEKEHLKEEKKAEAELKKEEAKATHDSSKAVEAAEAAAVAAVPAAAIAAAEKKEDKKEEDEITTPTDKKSKRASVFGSFFGKKGVTSPTTEKTEKEAVGPAVPAKESEIPPVSETAPKLDEPIENKPIDTAAVTGPVDTIETPTAATAIPTEEPAKEVVTAPEAETTTSPKTEKKGGFLAGLIKKAEIKKDEKKEETKEEKAAEVAVKDPVVAAAPSDIAAPATTEAPATETAETKEERPAREKRRTSFFSALGTIKKKSPESAEADNAAAPEIKREKSPLPNKLGGIFRKASKAVKPTETEKPVETEAAKTEVAATEATPAAVGTTDSNIVGDVVPEDLHATIHDAVTMAPEVKTTA